jgi:hypothetical protein
MQVRGFSLEKKREKFFAGLALERMKRTPPYLVAIFLDILLPFSYIQLIPKQVLIISLIGRWIGGD